MDFHVDIDKALRGLQAASDKVHKGIQLYGQTAALKMEAYAKANRPWHDRTGSARNTLKGISGWGYISADMTIRQTKKHNEYGYLHAMKSVSNPNVVGYGSHFTVGVAGNMPYSPYLEYGFGGSREGRYGGRYGILWRTVHACSAETIRGWAAMLNALH